MFYYAEIDSDYKVINTHSLSEASTNPNYIPITEELYNNGNGNGSLLNQYYNTLYDIYESLDPAYQVGKTPWITHKETMMPLSTKTDNMDKAISLKADINHTHDGYASSDDLALLEDIVDTKANTNHSHTEYAIVNHSHSEYATQMALDALSEEVDGKANVSHSHTEYALSSHGHDDYAEVGHNHDSSYAPISHSHSDYVTTTDFNALETEVDGKASASHSHNNYAETTHNHDTDYADISHTHTASEVGAATSTHNHDTDYADINHNHDDAYATAGHDHDTDYSAIDHVHTNYATVTSVEELSATVSGKANASHTHDDRYYTETEIDAKLADKADSSHVHTGVYDASGAAASALTAANTYTDEAIDTLSETVATKASASDLTSHTGNTTVHISSTERTNWNVAKTHADSAHAPTNAEPNQNAFSNVVVGDVTISADTKTDTLTLVAGNNVTITPDSIGDSITISSANTVYTHPTSAGNKHIPAGGSSGQILRWASDGTAVWGSDNNTTYSNATQTSSGLMSNTDKTKLDGIVEGANNYTLPSAGTSLGGVKSGGDVTISSGVITVNDDSHNHVISNVDGLQSALDGKAASGHNHNDTYYTETEVDTLLGGKANSSHTHTIANITNLQSTLDGKAATSHGTHVSYSTTAPVMDGSASVGTASTVARSDHKHPTDTSRAAQTSLDSHTGNTSNPHGVTLSQLGVTATAAELNALDGITATVTELNYVDGVTSNIQTQLNGKAASGHTHSYAGSSSVGGAATSANKLNTNAGSATQPVYFANGVPVATTYTLGKSVPSNAVFTDTTYGVATTSVNGLMSASDKSKLDGMVLATVSEVEAYLGI